MRLWLIQIERNDKQMPTGDRFVNVNFIYIAVLNTTMG